ncbi:MAG: hypothetical protein LWY06_07855 [Firmicutes bacterium]|nr:hypothetical protein [Bacillota bacterium]
MAKNLKIALVVVMAIAFLFTFAASKISYAGNFDDKLTNDSRIKPTPTEEPVSSPTPSPEETKVTPTPKKTATPAATEDSGPVNVRLINDSKKINKVMTPAFIPGFYLIGEQMVVKKGKGFLKGDCSIRKVYVNKTKKEYDKIVAGKEELKTDMTVLTVTVDLYSSKKEMEKNLANKQLRNEEANNIADQTWTGSMKVDPRQGEKEGNYNSNTLLVTKSNAQVLISAYNYMSEPSTEDWNSMQEAAGKILGLIK